MSVNSLSCLMVSDDLYDELFMIFLCFYIVDEVMVMCCVFLQFGNNALHNAARKGHADVANLLTE